MNDAEKALAIVAKTKKILPPVTYEQSLEKIDEIKKRMIRNLPYKARKQCEGLSQEEVMDKFYSRGNKVD